MVRCIEPRVVFRNDRDRDHFHETLKRRYKMKLKDKVAVITGAARGIGAALALGYAKEGARIVIAHPKQNTTKHH